MAVVTPVGIYGTRHDAFQAGDTVPPAMAGIPAIVTTGHPQADVGACATDAVAIGVNAAAAGTTSVAAGSGASAPILNGVAIGRNAVLTNDNPQTNWSGGVAIGYKATVHYDGLALGAGSIAYRGTAIGGGQVVDDASLGVGAVAICHATVQGQNAIAVGEGASTVYGVAIGDKAVMPNIGVAIGHVATATASGVVIGPYSSMQNSAGTALGWNAVSASTGFQSVALGAYSVAARSEVVSFGHTSTDFPLLNIAAKPPDVVTQQFRQLACVAGGAYQHDAINGEQFNQLASAINQLGAGVSGFTPIALLPLEP